MTARLRPAVIAAVVSGGTLLVGAASLVAGGDAPAGASPVPAAAANSGPALTGGCSLTVTFPTAGTVVNPTTLRSTTVVKVPPSQTVSWEGALTDGSPGAGHRSNGNVVVELPIGQVSVKTWSKPFGPASDHGHVYYDFPSVLDNVKLPVAGHEDDDGTRICTGSGILEVTASTFKSPLTYGSLAGIVVFGAGLLLSGRRRLTA